MHVLGFLTLKKKKIKLLQPSFCYIGQIRVLKWKLFFSFSFSFSLLILYHFGSLLSQFHGHYTKYLSNDFFQCLSIPTIVAPVSAIESMSDFYPYLFPFPAYKYHLLDIGQGRSSLSLSLSFSPSWLGLKICLHASHSWLFLLQP